jgi:hypothetical protein
MKGGIVMKKTAHLLIVILISLFITTAVAGEVMETPWDITWGMSEEQFLNQFIKKTGASARILDIGGVASSDAIFKQTLGEQFESIIAIFTRYESSSNEKTLLKKNTGLNRIYINYKGLLGFKNVFGRATQLRADSSYTDARFSVEDELGSVLYLVDLSDNRSMWANIEDAIDKWPKVSIQIAWGNYAISMYKGEKDTPETIKAESYWEDHTIKLFHAPNESAPIPYKIQ